MKKKALLSAMGLSLIAAVASAHADGLTYDVGANVGTLGIGPQVGVVIVPDQFALRLNTGFLSFNQNKSSNGIDYAGSMSLKNASLFADYHPYSGAFRLTAGLALDDNSISLSGTPTAGQTYTLNGTSYTASANDHANASVAFNKMAPYLGIGFGSASSDSGLHFTSDFGLMYMGAPMASLSITTSNPSVQSAANQYAATELDKLNTAMNRFKWYPVAQIGAIYRFK